MNWKNKRGMTLIEMALAILIFSIIMISVTKVFSSYIKVRNQGSISQQEIEEMSVTMNEINKKLRMSNVNASCNGYDFGDQIIKVCDNSGDGNVLFGYSFDGASKQLKDIYDNPILDNVCGGFEYEQKDRITLVKTNICKTENDNCSGDPCKPGTLMASSVSMRSGYKDLLAISSTSPPIPPGTAPIPAGTASGGTVSSCGSGYTCNTFTSSGTFSLTSDKDVEVFLVGGGGSGGGSFNGPGGGGGGGYTRTETFHLPAGNYPVTVGSGGEAVSTNDNGNPGSPSSFFGYTAAGGSGGRIGSVGSGGSGGSGGGGGMPVLDGGGFCDFPSEGAGGSNGLSGGNGWAVCWNNPVSTSFGGNGQGSTTREFGSGAGALYSSGGSGGRWPSSTWAAPAAANSGNGGAGGNYDHSGSWGASGAGGSGIVIIRYLTP